MTRRSPGDGTLETAEISDLDEGELGEVRMAESDLAMVISEQDVMDLVTTIEPSHSAVVLAGENQWAARSARRSAGPAARSRTPWERRRHGTGQSGRSHEGQPLAVHRRPPADALEAALK